MNIKYFITACVTFFSISFAQGASFLISQKFGEKIFSADSSRDFIFSKQLSDTLSQVFQMEVLGLNNHQQQVAVKLVPVSSVAKKRAQPNKGRKGRPKLSVRNPFSL
ncbi:hypothetical protein [Bartonella raoultii]|uniref:Uncharacterized protein n=1 Tax=Bartonella raoultii TaxID=1457020 RepID=A0ABS7I575_9HYPH|nr:hypothetical protein [Bartonella raoultii]MBX4335500.1 hypothetical protein [Bartonella raoultii]